VHDRDHAAPTLLPRMAVDLSGGCKIGDCNEHSQLPMRIPIRKRTRATGLKDRCTSKFRNGQRPATLMVEDEFAAHNRSECSGGIEFRSLSESRPNRNCEEDCIVAKFWTWSYLAKGALHILQNLYEITTSQQTRHLYL
jgi:hypothetical protein